MAAILHDQAVCASIRARVEKLRPDSPRQWGKMTIDQMLWHVNQGLGQPLGHVSMSPVKSPLPKPLLKFAVLNIPWPKGARTLPELVADMTRADFHTEKARCLALIEEFTAKSVDSAWPRSATLGSMSGADWSRLHAKHLNHHLTQFNV